MVPLGVIGRYERQEKEEGIVENHQGWVIGHLEASLDTEEGVHG